MAKKSDKKPIEQYNHKGKKRLNNPPVGLVTPETDRETGKKTYAYDPHIDPSLQWTGKAERTSFEVPTVSLHVHERIDPKTIIQAVKKKNGNGQQPSLFQMPEENPPLREAIHFYKHKHNWSNRLIAGDSLLVMNSLLEKEGMGGQVQMIYIDPPYGIKYGSNFQPFVNKRDVKDGNDEDLTQEPEMIKAFRDTWELGIHSYLTYLRDRLLLARELLHESGSIFVQISDENIHHIRELMDEIFGHRNFVSIIPFRKKTMPLGAMYLDSMNDFLLWYSKDASRLKFRQLYQYQNIQGDFHWKWYEDSSGKFSAMTKEELNNHTLLPKGVKIFRVVSMKAPGYSAENDFDVTFEGRICKSPKGGSWITGKVGMDRLQNARRLFLEGQTLTYKLYYDDFPLSKITNIWNDTVGAFNKVYVVQTNELVIQRCLLMSTDPGDLVLDITCGSGTTAYVAENWGRRWITCDTSRVAVALAKQRLMTAVFDYYQLARPDEGVGSGFVYKKVPHITLKAIASNEPLDEAILYDQPMVDNERVRVTGPFTIEAVPATFVKPLSDMENSPAADESIIRSGETIRQDQLRAELLAAGIRGKGGQRIVFSRVEPLSGTRWLQAEAETRDDNPQRVVICFGPEYAPLEQKMVEMAIKEAEKLKPTPKMIVFAAFQFDPEAAKDIDNIQWTGVTLLKVQMNTDLLTDDLKKKRSSNESYWLIGQPDVEVEKLKKGDDKGKYIVRLNGFDYYNTKTGIVESGGTEKIAMWMLDTDYDERSLFPQQVFFPMAGEKEGWSKLSKNLKTEIDENLIKAYRGTVSLPFEAGKNRHIAVKIIDDRGIESLKILELD